MRGAIRAAPGTQAHLTETAATMAVDSSLDP